jgi:hypothetical protein
MEELKFLTLQGLELRSLGSPARGQSLYQLANPKFGPYDPMRLMNFFDLPNPSCRTRPWSLLGL